MIAIQAIGRLGKDAEVQTLESGKKVIKFSIAVDTGYGDNKKTLWLECSKWGENTAVSQYLVKGTQVHIAGEPSLNTYTNKDGKEVTTLRLSCSNITLVGSKQDSGNIQPAANSAMQQPATQLPELDESLPF